MTRFGIVCVTITVLWVAAFFGYLVGSSKSAPITVVVSEPPAAVKVAPAAPVKVEMTLEEIKAAAGTLVGYRANLDLIRTADYRDDSLTGRRERLEKNWKKNAPKGWAERPWIERELITFYAIKFGDDLLEERKFINPDRRLASR